MARALATIVEFSGASAASLWLREGPKVARFSATATRPPSLRVAIGDGGQQEEGLAGTTAGPERLAPILGCALVSQRAQAAVHERVKELTCLYGITQLTQRPEMRLDHVVSGIVRLLPPACQYPEVAVARVVLDGKTFTTPSSRRGTQRQSAEIVGGGAPRPTRDRSSRRSAV